MLVEQRHALDVGLAQVGDQVVTEVLAPFGEAALERDPDAVRALWTAIGEVQALTDGTGDIWRVSVKPSDGPAVLAAAKAEAAMMDWGGGLVWLRLAEGADLRARLSHLPGHATLIQGAAGGTLPAFHPEPAPVAALSRGLRTRFDPRGILNPGLMAA